MTRVIIVLVNGGYDHSECWYGNGVNKIGHHYAEDLRPVIGESAFRLRNQMKKDGLSINGSGFSMGVSLSDLLVWIDCLLVIHLDKNDKVEYIEEPWDRHGELTI